MTSTPVIDIEVRKRDDGTYEMKEIHWLGKYGDGSWNHHILTEAQVKRILDIVPAVPVPTVCTECDHYMESENNGITVCGCLLRPLILFDGEIDYSILTKEQLSDERWGTSTPNWCPFKQEGGKRHDQEKKDDRSQD